tara:strand:- start:1929 stop:2405 length:477 start_codon:yes stop_codon:yes gene_type:complete
VKKLFIIFLFQINAVNALEVSCKFEEVYGNGDVQQGLLFLKNQKLRYEYFDKNLFTIIAKNGNFFLINQAHKNNVSKINNNTEILEMFMNIALDYPNLKSTYSYEKTNIIVEKSSNSFIKRVSINAENVNVSINLFNCKFENIHNKYFNHFNFEKVSK